MKMEPVIKLTLCERPYRRCYGCGEQSVYDLAVGHTIQQGTWRTGNEHQLALCGGCLQLLREQLDGAA